jgi:hypothetical protein
VPVPGIFQRDKLLQEIAGLSREAAVQAVMVLKVLLKVPAQLAVEVVPVVAQFRLWPIV